MTSEIATLMRDRNYHLKRQKVTKLIFIGNNTVLWEIRSNVKSKSRNRSITTTLLKILDTILVIYGNSSEAIPGSNLRKDNVTSLISDGITHINPTSMSSIFIKIFATIGVKLAEKFTMRNTPTTNGVNQASSIFAFKTISCESVIKMINDLNLTRQLVWIKWALGCWRMLPILLHQVLLDIVI